VTIYTRVIDVHSPITRCRRHHTFIANVATTITDSGGIAYLKNNSPAIDKKMLEVV